MHYSGRSIIYRHIIFFVLRMTTATASELELLVLGMDGDDVAGEDNADMSDEAEPGDDELKEEEAGEEKEEVAE